MSLFEQLLPFQRRSVNNLNHIFKDKDIISIKKNDEGFYEIKYGNGQLFKCKGLIVDNSLICEKEEIVKKKLF